MKYRPKNSSVLIALTLGFVGTGLSIGGFAQSTTDSRTVRDGVFSAAVIVVSIAIVATAQAPPPQGGAPGGGRGGPRLVLSVRSTGWPDGGEVPMRHAGRGDNKSPAFEFHWSLGTKCGFV
jgi:hypothetical protein